MAGVKGQKQGVLFGAATHGIRATYARGCRCDACREAWRIARGPKVAARRARMTAEEREAINAKRRAARVAAKEGKGAGAGGEA